MHFSRRLSPEAPCGYNGPVMVEERSKVGVVDVGRLALVVLLAYASISLKERRSNENASKPTSAMMAWELEAE